MRSTHKQTTRAVIVQGKHTLCAGLEGDLADPTKVVAAADHHGRFGIADEVFHLSALVSRVQRQEHIARTQSG